MLSIALEYPEDIDSTEHGASSQEKTVQEEREKNALGAIYFDGSQIPDTPGEPASQIPFDQVDRDVRAMVAGPEIQPFFQQAMSVSDLVGQLAVGPGNVAPGTFSATESGIGLGGGDITMTDGNSTFAGGFDLGKLDPNALSSLAASLGLAGFNFSGAAAAAAPETNGYTAQNASSWGTYNQHQQPPQQQAYADSGYPPNDRDRDERGGRGGFRGRGRGAPRGRGGGGGETKSRKRCNYYAQGRRASDPFLFPPPGVKRVKNSG